MHNIIQTMEQLYCLLLISLGRTQFLAQINSLMFVVDQVTEKLKHLWILFTSMSIIKF